MNERMANKEAQSILFRQPLKLAKMWCINEASFLNSDLLYFQMYIAVNHNKRYFYY